MTSRSLTVDLLLDLAAPSTARTLTRAALRQWGVRPDDVLATAGLVVTELVTNALAHCGADEPAVLELRLLDRHVRVAVTDCGPGMPRQREARDTDEGGRGMLLIAQLSDDWGVEPQDRGKRVYALLALAGDQAGAGV